MTEPTTTPTSAEPSPPSTATADASAAVPPVAERTSPEKPIPSVQPTPSVNIKGASARGPFWQGSKPWLMAGLFLIGVVIWQGLEWYDLRHRVSQTQEQLARRLVESAAQLKDATTLAANAQDALHLQATKITQLEGRVAELNQQHMALEGLFQELSRGRDEWLLSEVDQLVGLAVQKLQLAGDVQGALIVLNNAEARLARSDRAQFVSLRKALAKDIQKLRNLPQVDVSGVALRLENVALASDKMVLAFEARPGSPAASPARQKTVEKPREAPPQDAWQWWGRWGAEVWSEVGGLLRIERLDRPDPAILAPQNIVFLRENLKIRLMGARLALLARDQAGFKGELRQAVQWLEKYFDGRDRNVQSALESLRPLLAADVSIEPPALTESQGALRLVKLSADRVVR